MASLISYRNEFKRAHIDDLNLYEETKTKLENELQVRLIQQCNLKL